MRNFLKSGVVVTAIAVSPMAFAQSTVTLYGIIEDSIQYTHNTGGANNQIKLQSGQLSVSQWGVKGTEDLGGGLKAVFNLQNGFNANTGAMSGGLLFGRKAYVGLASATFGTVTIGRQSTVLDDLVISVQGNNFLEYFTAPGDVDEADGSIHVSNAVKWASPLWSGLQLEAMYSVGGVAGATGSGSTYSVAANYNQGPLTLAAGYFHVDNGNPTTSSRGVSTADSIFSSPVNAAYATARSFNIARAGASYVLGTVTFGGYYSYSEYLADASSKFKSSESYNNASVYAMWQVTPATELEIGYDLLKSHGDSAATYHQITLAADYALSKRTDIYASASYEHASGSNGTGPAQAVIADAYVGGGTSTQELVMVGIRHKF
ncbi:porin [Paraburkholderia sp. D1E]|uniref:porin n=1 Tax=Paraburkholderia sp. D1E TaxID=3461398 RepID=UPI004045E93F